MDQELNACDNIARILNGKGKIEKDVCSVTIDRKDIQATIGGKPYHSLHHMFEFETPDSSGNSLITGEMVLLEDEVPRVTSAIQNAGIIVSAIHSHWLFDSPKLMYMHVESIMNPVTFATNIARIIA